MSTEAQVKVELRKCSVDALLKALKMAREANKQRAAQWVIDVLKEKGVEVKA